MTLDDLAEVVERLRPAPRPESAARCASCSDRRLPGVEDRESDLEDFVLAAIVAVRPADARSRSMPIVFDGQRAPHRPLPIRNEWLALEAKGFRWYKATHGLRPRCAARQRAAARRISACSPSRRRSPTGTSPCQIAAALNFRRLPSCRHDLRRLAADPLSSDSLSRPALVRRVRNARVARRTRQTRRASDVWSGGVATTRASRREWP